MGYFLRALLRMQVDAWTVRLQFSKLITLQPLLFWLFLFYFVFDKAACSLSWPATMQIYWSKRKCLHKKRFSSHRTGLEHLEHQHGRRFIVLGHQYGRRDVMWKRSKHQPIKNNKPNNLETCSWNSHSTNFIKSKNFPSYLNFLIR